MTDIDDLWGAINALKNEMSNMANRITSLFTGAFGVAGATLKTFLMVVVIILSPWLVWIAYHIITGAVHLL